MEHDTFGGAILAWVKSAKAFLKVQAGTGDNLLEEDSMVLFRENCTPGEALESSYRQAFEKDYDGNDVVVLMEE